MEVDKHHRRRIEAINHFLSGECPFTKLLRPKLPFNPQVHRVRRDDSPTGRFWDCEWRHNNS
jgi:hypothetical protein